MNKEELACFNAIKLIEVYVTNTVLEYTIRNTIMQQLADLKTFHSLTVGYRVIKESNNG